jgi:hypothetical protein
MPITLISDKNFSKKERKGLAFSIFKKSRDIDSTSLLSVTNNALRNVTLYYFIISLCSQNGNSVKSNHTPSTIPCYVQSHSYLSIASEPLWESMGWLPFPNLNKCTAHSSSYQESGIGCIHYDSNYALHSLRSVTTDPKHQYQLHPHPLSMLYTYNPLNSIPTPFKLTIMLLSRRLIADQIGRLIVYCTPRGVNQSIWKGDWKRILGHRKSLQKSIQLVLSAIGSAQSLRFDRMDHNTRTKEVEFIRNWLYNRAYRNRLNDCTRFNARL